MLLLVLPSAISNNSKFQLFLIPRAELTCSDLDLHREDDELVLVGGVGFDADEGGMVVGVS